jgi:MoaA/NifB/PqqE/SkfB family radical SAM enzyme
VIRKVYWDMIRRKVKEQGAGWLVRRGRQYVLLHLSPLVKRALCGPALGTLMVTYRCNYHCAMCDMPIKAGTYLRSGLRERDTEWFRKIIGEFASLGVPGIGFTGGEPLLREDIFDLLALTRRYGMIAHLNTNGSLLNDAAARHIIEIGVDSVNISLDGPTAATHDRIRNHSGAFERAIEAVKLLQHYRKKSGGNVRIKTVAVLDGTNLDEVPAMIRLNRELGTDCVEFIPRQPFRASDHTAREAPQEALLARVDKTVSLLLEQKKSSGIENSPAHLRLFRTSFSGKPCPVRCGAGYNSLAVDCYGFVFPCVPWINWGKSIGMLGEGSLSEFWRSSEYQKKRADILRCNDCYLNCQTELNLLFDMRSLLFRGCLSKGM